MDVSIKNETWNTSTMAFLLLLVVFWADVQSLKLSNEARTNQRLWLYFQHNPPKSSKSFLPLWTHAWTHARVHACTHSAAVVSWVTPQRLVATLTGPEASSFPVYIMMWNFECQVAPSIPLTTSPRPKAACLLFSGNYKYSPPQPHKAPFIWSGNTQARGYFTFSNFTQLNASVWGRDSKMPNCRGGYAVIRIAEWP